MFIGSVSLRVSVDLKKYSAEQLAGIAGNPALQLLQLFLFVQELQ